MKLTVSLVSSRRRPSVSSLLHRPLTVTTTSRSFSLTRKKSVRECLILLSPDLLNRQTTVQSGCSRLCRWSREDLWKPTTTRKDIAT
ncbi:hypothetical protein L1987_71224 [Smallanthus sonchifolius]|uniref:Uncharacterized protein n=1 Tax=Smallanthus sonchifolius TaxID=185202 RepID=A0ACB9AS37_9ASTR|nr:hypothetical protein L1987_71224 [Smallanthus sonchifolius]